MGGAALAMAALIGAAACRSGRDGASAFRRVQPAVADQILRDSPDISILDLRPAEEFNGPQGHLKGAYNIPEQRLPSRLIEIGGWRDQTFLVYCGDARCGEEPMAVLHSSGFRDGILIDGGLAAWVESGFDVVVSKQSAAPAAAVEERKR